METSDKHHGYESMGTIVWMLMDACWIFELQTISCIISPIPAILFLISCVSYKGRKMSDIFVIFSTFFWFLMNSLWIFSDLTDKEEYIIMAKLMILPAIILLILAFLYSRKEGSTFLFRRIR